MLPRHDPLPLIESLYDAALDASRWPAALGGIVEHLGGYGGNILLIGNSARDIPLWVSMGLEAGEREYREWVHDIDPAIGFAFEHPDCRVQYDYLYTDEAAMNRSPYYDWLGKFDLRYCIIGRIFSGPEHTGFFSVQRMRGAGHVQSEDIGRFERLRPHVERALQVAFKLDTLSARVAGDDWLLDRLAQAVVLLDRQGRVVRLNRAAERILSAGDGLKCEDRELKAARGSDQARLKTRIGAALRAFATGQGADAAVAVSRPSGNRAYALLVAPLPARAFALEQPGVVVFLTDPEHQPPLPGEMLQLLYGLTPTEARIALALAAGHSLQQAAAQMSITRTTARSHLDAVLRKTGTHRQSELVALLLRIPSVDSGAA